MKLVALLNIKDFKLKTNKEVSYMVGKSTGSDIEVVL